MRKIVCFLKKLASPAVIAELAGTVYLVITVIEHHTENGVGAIGFRGIFSIICAVLTLVGVVCSPEGQKNAIARLTNGKKASDTDQNAVTDIIDGIAKLEAEVGKISCDEPEKAEVKSNDGQ